MPSTGTAAIAGSTLVLLVIGAGAGTQALDVSGDLEKRLGSAVDNAMRDLAVGWLEVQDAHGATENGSIERVEMLVRLDGTVQSVEPGEVIARAGHGGELNLSTTEVMRDEDGSMDNGTMNEGDLVEWTLVLDEPLEPSESADVTLHSPGTSPLTVTLETPRYFSGDDYVRMDTRVTW